MDIQWMFLIFSIPLLTFLLYSATRRRSNPPFPPGPPRFPILGNIHIMSQLNHHGLTTIANKYGGLCYLKLGSLHIYTISTPEIAKQVLQTHDVIFSNRPATIAIKYLTYDRADMVFAHYSPFWRQVRKLCVAKLFSKERAVSWESVKEEIEAMISIVKSNVGSCVNIGELAFNLTMNITFRAAFGSRFDRDQDEFLEIMQEFSKLFGTNNVNDFIPWLGCVDIQGIKRRSRIVRKKLDVFIDRIIDEHEASPKEKDGDMVDEMLVFLNEGKRIGKDVEHLMLDRNNIKAIIMDIMFGGTGPVTSAIEWTMAELMRSPEDLKRVREELADVVGLDRKVDGSDLDKLTFLKCVVKETLRLHPPTPLLFHEAAEDCEIEGYFVCKKSRVLINVWAIGRDESVWKDGSVFKPSRFGEGGGYDKVDLRGNCFELLPFGSGRRSCPGMQLGLYALELAVGQLVHCFDWELPDGMRPDELDMRDTVGITVTRAVRLSAVPTLRLNCDI